MITALTRRQLFSGGAETGQTVLSVLPSPGAGQPLVFSPMKISVSSGSVGSELRNGSTSNHSGKAKRTGSLSLFLRKVYNLAHLRLETLCNSMQVRKYLLCLFFCLLSSFPLTFRFPSIQFSIPLPFSIVFCFSLVFLPFPFYSSLPLFSSFCPFHPCFY